MTFRLYNLLNALHFNNPNQLVKYKFYTILYTFTFMHLPDAFIQSDLQWIQIIHFLSVCVLGIKPTTFAANAMLYHWATGTHHFIYAYIKNK